MAVNFVQASSQALSIDQNLVGSDVYTWAAWTRITAKTGTDQTAIWSGDKDVTSAYARMQYQDATDRWRFRFSNGTATEVLCSAAPTTGQWHNICVVHASTTDRRIYMDNGSSGTDTTNKAGINGVTDRFCVGRVGEPTPGDYGNFDIAHVAVWNIALDETQRQQLADGFLPTMIAPQNLVAYFPFPDVNQLRNPFGGQLLSTVGTPTTASGDPDLNGVVILATASAEGNGPTDVADSVATLGFTLAENDLVVACVSNNDSGGTLQIEDNNSGAFVPITGKHQGNTFAHRCFYYKVGATPLTTFNFDMGGYSGRMTRTYIQLRNVNLNHVLAGVPVKGIVSGGGPFTAMDAASGDGALALVFGTNDNVSTTGDDWQGWDDFAEFIEANGAAGQQQAGAYYQMTSIGVPPQDSISKSPNLHTLFSINPADRPGTAIQPIGKTAEAVSTSASGSIDISITVPTGASLLLVTAGYWGAARAEIEDWTAGSEPFVFVCADEGGLGGDVAYKVWAIVNPTAKTNTITVTITGDTNYHWVNAACFENTATSSVHEAITVLEQNDNALAETTTLAFSQAGEYNSALVVTAAALGDDMAPDYLGAEIDAGFTHLVSGSTGGADPGNNDGSYYLAFRHEGKPVAPTITWALSDENAGAFLQLNPPAEATESVIYMPTASRWAQGFSGLTVTPEFLDYAYAPVTGFPLTMAAWAMSHRPNSGQSNDGSDCVCQLNQSGNSGYMRLGLGDSLSSNPRIRSSSTDEAFGPSSYNGIKSNRWHSWVGVATSSYFRFYLDGWPGTDDTAISAFPITPDSFSIGYENDSSPADPWPGGIKWVAVWNAELSPVEARMFAAGVCPLFIRRQNLKFFAPLDGTNKGLRDLISGTMPTHNGASGIKFKGPTEIALRSKKFLLAPSDVVEVATFERRFTGMFSGTIR